jgi:hypothetical protein
LKLNFVAGNQDTSALNDLGYSGFRATPLNETFDGSKFSFNGTITVWTVVNG